MKKLVSVIILLVIGNFLKGQNLIVNPSFEEVNEISTRWSGTGSAFNRWIKHWNSPTQGSPDLLFTGTLGKMFPKRPKVDLIAHTPRTGNFMVGIKTYGCETNTLHCKEYLQIKLKEPLQSGEQYFFEYWVCPVKSSVKVNSFGLVLSLDGVKEYTQSGLLDIYPISISEELIDGDTTEWQRISGVFESDDNYQHILIGNFSPDSSIEFKKEPDGLEYGYYMVDDVLLRPLHQKISPKIKVNEKIILNNILFETNKANIQEVSKPELNELVAFLNLSERYHLKIMGHTDSQGDMDQNIVLSNNRANSIKQFLIENGIDESRIKAVGFGSAYPILNLSLIHI